MALTECPNCGQEISDKAKKCMHCGAELFFCPECGTFSVRTGNACPKCGYEPASAPAVKPQPVSGVFKTDLLKTWELSCPAEAQRKRILWGLQVAFFAIAQLVGFLLLVLHVVGVIYPLDKTAVFKLGYFSDCKSFIENVFIAAVILGCFAAVFRIFAIYQRVSPIARWLKKGTFDTVGFLKTQDRIRSGKKGEAFWAAYCVLSPNGKIMYGVSCCASGIMFLDNIFFYKFFRDMALEHLKSVVTGTNFAFSIPWLLLVLVLSFIIICGIISMIPWMKCKKFLKPYTAQGGTQS